MQLFLKDSVCSKCVDDWYKNKEIGQNISESIFKIIMNRGQIELG